MATTTNYGWTTPDDTALVKDGASAIRSLGTAIDTTTKNLNPETTLGDISYRSSTANTKTRLAIGTTGQVLTVSGGVPAWATPSGTGKSWTLLNAGGTALTGASTITVSGISGKEDLLIIVINCSSVNANSFIRIEPNGISANYVNAYNFWNPNSTYAAGDFGHTASTAFANITLGALSNSATGTLSGAATISGCSGTGNKAFISNGAGNGGSGQYLYVGQGFIPASAAITSVNIVSSSGNFDAGTVYVYGA